MVMHTSQIKCIYIFIGLLMRYAIHHSLKKYAFRQHYALYGRRQWHPTPVLLPGKSHGWRSLVGCSPWGHQESGQTQRLHFHFSLSCIGEGNGNSLQCSCLENPRDRGAWWADVYAVTALDWSDLAAAAACPLHYVRLSGYNSNL